MSCSAAAIVARSSRSVSSARHRRPRRSCAMVACVRTAHGKTWSGLCEAAARVLTRGEPLRADGFDPPSAMTTATAEDFGDLPARVADANAGLSGIRDALLARTDPIETTLRAAAFGIRVPGLLLGASPSLEQQDALASCRRIPVGWSHDWHTAGSAPRPVRRRSSWPGHVHATRSRGAGHGDVVTSRESAQWSTRRSPDVAGCSGPDSSEDRCARRRVAAHATSPATTDRRDC